MVLLKCNVLDSGVSIISPTPLILLRVGEITETRDCRQLKHFIYINKY